MHVLLIGKHAPLTSGGTALKLEAPTAVRPISSAVSGPDRRRATAPP